MSSLLIECFDILSPYLLNPVRGLTAPVG
jgi:hypothetical protein